MNPYHSQIHDPVKVRGLEALVTAGSGADCIAVPNPSHGVMVNEYAQVPLCTQQSYGISLPVKIHLYYRT